MTYDQALQLTFAACCAGGLLGMALSLAGDAYDWLTARLSARRKLRAAMAAKWKGVCQ